MNLEIDLEKIESEIKKFKLDEDYTVSDNETGTITYAIKSEAAKKDLRIKVFGTEKDEIDGTPIFGRGKGNCGGFGHPFYHYQENKEDNYPDYFTIESGEDKRKKDNEWKEEAEAARQKKEEKEWKKELNSLDKKVRENCFLCHKIIGKINFSKNTPTITRIKITEKGQELVFCSFECYNNHKKKTNELENKQKLNKSPESNFLIFSFLSLIIITILPVIYLLVKKRK
ncbi:hypothetical protein [endosymbiont GvMRE of Glomus versiforme]|uniref:hypothetical protein n=1 Tax=endosymbiont GvMRE of Glomus versiforme TaxID=2039283 RepID=UPI000EDA4A73|nr:hypothetical protein [endosymbiont GvMRE of Glomus versiforme]RHZ37303.1 hypothetical protein GvMRE_I1g78 [endosymbiont GvMRE of Glomus versiforme]